MLAERAPSVTLIDPGYDVPRSWRSSLDWSQNIRSLLVRVGGMVSYDLNQPGTVDANFSGVQQLTLAADGGRPVYVSTASIDPTTGAVSASESRRSAEFGRVVSRVSDLRGYGGQLTFGLSPDVFKFRTRRSVFASLNYTLQASRRQYRGFDGAGFGDPRVVEWAPSQSDARHVIVMTGGVGGDEAGHRDTVRAGAIRVAVHAGGAGGRERRRPHLRSCLHPGSRARERSRARRQPRSLMDGGSASARRCLQSYLGQVAAAQRMSRAVDAVAERAVAPYDARNGGEAG